MVRTDVVKKVLYYCVFGIFFIYIIFIMSCNGPDALDYDLFNMINKGLTHNNSSVSSIYIQNFGRADVGLFTGMICRIFANQSFQLLLFRVIHASFITMTIGLISKILNRFNNNRLLSACLCCIAIGMFSAGFLTEGLCWFSAGVYYLWMFSCLLLVILIVIDDISGRYSLNTKRLCILTISCFLCASVCTTYYLCCLIFIIIAVIIKLKRKNSVRLLLFPILTLALSGVIFFRDFKLIKHYMSLLMSDDIGTIIGKAEACIWLSGIAFLCSLFVCNCASCHLKVRRLIIAFTGILYFGFFFLSPYWQLDIQLKMILLVISIFVAGIGYIVYLYNTKNRILTCYSVFVGCYAVVVFTFPIGLYGTLLTIGLLAIPIIASVYLDAYAKCKRMLHSRDTYIVRVQIVLVFLLMLVNNFSNIKEFSNEFSVNKFNDFQLQNVESDQVILKKNGMQLSSKKYNDLNKKDQDYLQAQMLIYYDLPTDTRILYLEKDQEYVPYNMGDNLVINSYGSYCYDGFSFQEDWGRWTICNDVSLSFIGGDFEQGDIMYQLQLKLRSYVGEHTVHVSINGMSIGKMNVSEDMQELKFDIPAALLKASEINEIEFADEGVLVTPSKYEESSDTRNLGIAMYSVVVSRKN